MLISKQGAYNLRYQVSDKLLAGWYSHWLPSAEERGTPRSSPQEPGPRRHVAAPENVTSMYTAEQGSQEKLSKVCTDRTAADTLASQISARDRIVSLQLSPCTASGGVIRQRERQAPKAT